jgi:uncharacterized damage-inducible protein DinB
MPENLFAKMARYNVWANRRLYDACAELTDEDYFARRPAFFGSIHGTLNHILVADRIWRGRLEGSTAAPPALDAELYRERAALREAREAEDAIIVVVVDALDEAALGRPVTYRNSRGEPFTNPVWLVLQHFFNHQAHHRGQIHGMLSATPVAPPPLDLILYERSLIVSGPPTPPGHSPGSRARS